ncbi:MULTISPECIES: acyltransferase family protein [unclassified Streptomyces]|uniref:acyltransferase family protein n=1 Tax=unclassified Streptomyces TaxID=2593676 RepID=UPI000FA6CBF8|nr:MULTISPECIES: acyltransferase family protein [unclassified Streptomyces]MDH6452249.1 peptidoglycan/LPS O-acetylase OafA/YrhL [Streptomyces sp. SAI-119]MDH6497197.1 peptidoglycan/LPS O-acetylase OafA/YrhL [Streptomyces sp. SAI-149]
MTTDTRTRRRPPAAQTDRLRKYRPDIQGLRAVAIMMVVSMHCGILDIHGGVDVSFVLSGFLIGGQLLAEIDKTGKVSLTKFWARRFRRLAPGMAVTIIATAVLSWIYVSPFRFRDYMTDGLAASVSLINWRLAENGTDYFANDGSQSPYQHFWSLGIEEQFYVAAPIVLLVLVWLSRLVFRNRVLVALFLIAVVGGSFYLGYTQTSANQPMAYFSTPTRIWEISFGVLLALSATLLSRMNTGVAAVLTWIGLGTLLVTGLLITSETPLPGYAVAGPLLGAAMVIAGGCAAPGFGAEKVLDNPVLNFIGNVSYGWYLLHWPLLILFPSMIDREFAYSDRLRVAVFSFLGAIALHYIVEKRFRQSVRLAVSPWRGVFTGGALTASTVAAMVIALHVVPLNLSVAFSADNASATGYAGTESVKAAVARRSDPEISESNLLKSPDDQTEHGCIDNTEITKFAMRDDCLIGDPEGRKTVVVLGDSHAWQWGNAFQEVGKDLQAKIVTVAKGGCSPENYKIIRAELGREYTECASWRTSALDYIKELKPDVVVVTNRVQPTATRAGAEETFDALKATGARLVYMTDTPYPGFSVPDCLVENADDLASCTPKSEKVVDDSVNRGMEREVAEDHGAKVIDTIPAFCADGYCPAVIGGKVVYFDYSHMTGSYAESLAPFLEPTLKKALAG